VCDSFAIKTIYRGVEQFDWSDCFFAINFGGTVKEIQELKKFKKIVLSCHFQTFDVPALFQLFSQHQDQSFLFLIDQNIDIQHYKNLNDIFPNVTVIPWITWHHQLNSAIKWHGIADHAGPYFKKISCISGRQDIHKSIITACLINTFDNDDRVCSAKKARTHDPYWLNNSFNIPIWAKTLISDFYQSDIPPLSDQLVVFENQPILTVTNWNYPTFTECAVNLPLESQFNDVLIYQNSAVRIPGPMFTEKTWKPLLAGQSFLPVGQYHSCHSLQNYGISFDFGISLEFDQEPSEFTRLEKFLESIDQIKKMPHEELQHKSMINAEHNLNIIKSGTFFNLCEQHNQQVLPQIEKWIKQ
jgi:hypothetical protein